MPRMHSSRRREPARAHHWAALEALLFRNAEGAASGSLPQLLSSCIHTGLLSSRSREQCQARPLVDSGSEPTPHAAIIELNQRDEEC